MSFEFLSDMAIGPDEDAIEDVVFGRKGYACLKNAPWTIKAQVLGTGLAESDDFISVLKNGREKEDKKKGLPPRKGYPSIIKEGVVEPLTDTWVTFFQPHPTQLKLLPKASCILKFGLKLTAPFYSRDDLAFYPIENPIKREWVFKAPYLSASGIKGLLRWAWRMCRQTNDWDMERKIFGPSTDELEDENVFQGQLYTHPIFWKGKLGFEVINPHDRESGTGKNPIKYEVVQMGSTGLLYLTIINRNEDKLFIQNTIELLEAPLDLLLHHSGLSAKRSVGWGSVEVTSCQGWINLPPDEVGIRPDSRGAADFWEGLVDDEGNLKPVELQEVFTTAKLAELLDRSKSWVKKNKDEARTMVIKLWEKKFVEKKKTDRVNGEKFEIVEIKGKDIKELITKTKEALSTNA
ncbi:MAG: RAMP superfamily CRISPR-associated protein [Thermodesulfobacteriota bacterium]|nr:RAMP superfamily CRISPR-associated protein [Thermodesulfobacteriota bacterium]